MKKTIGLYILLVACLVYCFLGIRSTFFVTELGGNAHTRLIFLSFGILGAVLGLACVLLGAVQEKMRTGIRSLLPLPLFIVLCAVFFRVQRDFPVESVRDDVYFASRLFQNAFYPVNIQKVAPFAPTFGYASEFFLGFFLSLSLPIIIKSIREKSLPKVSLGWQDLLWVLLPLLIGYAETMGLRLSVLVQDIMQALYPMGESATVQQMRTIAGLSYLSQTIYPFVLLLLTCMISLSTLQRISMRRVFAMPAACLAALFLLARLVAPLGQGVVWQILSQTSSPITILSMGMLLVIALRSGANSAIHPPA